MRFMMLRDRVSRHSAPMPAVWITAPLVSRFMKLAKSSACLPLVDMDQMSLDPVDHIGIHGSGSHQIG